MPHDPQATQTRHRRSIRRGHPGWGAPGCPMCTRSEPRRVAPDLDLDEDQLCDLRGRDLQVLRLAPLQVDGQALGAEAAAVVQVDQLPVLAVFGEEDPVPRWPVPELIAHDELQVEDGAEVVRTTSGSTPAFCRVTRTPLSSARNSYVLGVKEIWPSQDIDRGSPAKKGPPSSRAGSDSGWHPYSGLPVRSPLG